MEISSHSPNLGDVSEISKILSTICNNGESFDKDIHLNSLIEKPWGYEYRVYCDCLFDIWKLHVNSSQSTSMHCHVQKDTVLVCLLGSGYTKFLDGEKHHIKPGDSIYIKRGVFHQTTASKNQQLQLIEVENPRNKYDLLRLKDEYGRRNTAYEKSSVSHDLLTIVESVGPGSFIRSEDLHKDFKFKLVKLSDENYVDEKVLFIVGVDVDHHLSREIVVLERNDNAIKNHLGKKALLISSF